MSGPKAYTMREMKGIVEYLVEHKAYGELKGRKMWMDFSNSSITTRTWQSLKETFLKRILPDIQNPYYRLTRDQVCSFRQGYDVAEKEKNNRLEIRRSSDERSNNAKKQNNSEQPLVTDTASTSVEKPNEVDKTAGEDIQSEKITARNRSSAETLILGDSNRQSNDNSTEVKEAGPKRPPKTMRDCLGFEESVPPPVVQAVLQDFGTDSNDSEESLIVVNTNKDKKNSNDQEVVVLEDSENMEVIENNLIIDDGGKVVEIGATFDPEIITEVSSNDLVNWLKECEGQKQTENNDETNIEQGTSNTKNVSNEAATSSVNEGSELVVDSETIVIEKNEESAENLNKKSNENSINNQNSLSSTNDTIIPNNQELLNTEVNKTNGTSNEHSLNKVETRKRSSSQEQKKEKDNKKKKVNNESEKTNEDKINFNSISIKRTQLSSNNTEALFGALNNAETTVDNTEKTQDVIEEPHENPCLKSVSLFEEQFNTTNYIDSEDEETPIAKNDVKQPEESIVNNNIPSKQNHNAESVKDNVSNTPTQEVIVETTTPSQNQVPVESQDKQSKIDPIPDDRANIQKLDENEVIMLEGANKTAPNTRKPRKNKHTLVLSSNSSDEVEQVGGNHKERYKRLSQAFGFVPGTSSTARRRRSFQNRRARLRTISRGHHESSDGDSNCTDIDDAEAFVSPPHGRWNRRGRKYKKPESGRLSFSEEGRVFAILGNKVYPIVSDGRDLNYVHYDVSDYEEESMWRRKYIDQKKKATELKKQIEQVRSEASSRNRSPVVESASLRNGGGGNPSASPAASDTNKNTVINIVQKDGDNKIQITLSNNNEDKINLEGQWPQVLPIMQHVMGIFYNPDSTTAVKANPEVGGTVPEVIEDISGRTTPVLPVNLGDRKVEDIEREIFQEIAQRGNINETDKPEKITNVSKRKTRTPSSNSEKSVKPSKITKKTKKSVDAKPEQTEDKAIIAESQDKPTESSVLIPDTSPKDQSPIKDNLSTKATKKVESGDKIKIKDSAKIGDKDAKAPKTLKLPPIEPRVTRSKKSGNETDTSTQSVTRTSIRKPKANSDEDEVRYMLPPGPKSRKSAAKLTPTKTGSPENPHEISQDRFGNSVDSTQGYQDSDATPMKNITKRKKKLSLVVKKGKHFRRKSFPSVSVDELSLDSSNSSYFVPIKSFSHPTLDSEIYKTESFKILMGGRKLSTTKLDVIEESSKTDDVRHCDAVSQTSNDSLVIEIGTGSSSIVSLPFSPELSVVENLSISREMLDNISHPTINEHQANDSVVSNLYNQYLIANVDVSVPLMQQDVQLLDTPKEKSSKKVKKPKAPAKSPIKVSDILNKVSSANISANSTLSDTLDQRLRNLLLESAQKMTNTSKENLMEVDVPIETKKGGKKRCSTPRKRITKKSRATVGPIIDEHMESCAKSGRQSCPPLSTFVPLDEDAINSADIQLKPKKPARVKKDIIRVKIQRPTKTKATDCNTSPSSVYTDSGINESESINEMVHGSDNVQLIHNHSDTCLQAHECIGDSIEFVDNSKSSVISIHSTQSLQTELCEVGKDMEEVFGQERLSEESESEEKCSKSMFATPTTTAYHSPIDHPNSSLITEDLSDENTSPPQKWYLLSEEETNSAHAHNPEQVTSNMRSSNYLKQIFPIACAVPDLSTISEISKENEDSRKTMGEDTGSSGFN